VIELPESGRPKAVAAAAKAVQAREADVAAARAALVEANRAIDRAVVADRDAYATALDAGHADPGREAETAARAEADEAKRRLDGEQVRLERVEVALREAIEQSLTAWQTALERSTVEAEVEALALVDQLRHAEEDRARRRLALYWVTSFAQRRQLPPVRFAASADTTLLRNRAASDRDYIGVFEVLDHVRAGIEAATLAAEAARLADPQRGRPILRGVAAKSDAA
jgi:hypothetical protein